MGWTASWLGASHLTRSVTDESGFQISIALLAAYIVELPNELVAAVAVFAADMALHLWIVTVR